MGAYCNSPIGREMVRQAQKLIREHGTAFAFCEKLRRFGWRDVNSLDDARQYIMERE